MKVRVQNFQTAKDVSFEIKGFTVIVGKNNSGKTALFRAIESALFNDPIGKNVRYGEKFCTVTITLPSFSFLWEKGEGKNNYTLFIDGKQVDYSKVGTQVPTEISSRFCEYRVDAENLRPQVGEWHSPIFLLNKSGSVATEMVTSVTRLDVVNLAIKNASKTTKKMRSKIKVREDDVKVAELSLRKLDPLDSIDINILDKLLSDIQFLTQERDLCTSWKTLQKNLNTIIQGLPVIPLDIVPQEIPAHLASSLSLVASWKSRKDSISSALASIQKAPTLEIPDTTLITDMVRELQQLQRLAQQKAALEEILPSLPTITDTLEVFPESLFQEYRQVSKWSGIFRDLIGKVKLVQESSDIDFGLLVELDRQSSNISQIQSIMTLIYRMRDTREVLRNVETEIQRLTLLIQNTEEVISKAREQIQFCEVCGSTYV